PPEPRPQSAAQQPAAIRPAPAARAAPTPRSPTPMPAPAASGDGQRILASPLARKIAAERGIDLRAVRGSGPGGRIVRQDVESLQPGAPAAGAAAPAEEIDDVVESAPTPPIAGDRDAEQTLSMMRKTIARRASVAKREG